MNSLVDPYDRRIFRDGQVVGVKYGGSVHQPTISYETIPNLGAGRFPEPGPRYGEFSPPVIYDNTEPSFIDRINRAPRFGGGFNIPGAPGNYLGMTVAQMPGRIRGNYRPRGVFGSPPPNFDSPYMDEKIRRGFVPMTPPVRRPGPQLPGFV